MSRQGGGSGSKPSIYEVSYVSDGYRSQGERVEIYEETDVQSPAYELEEIFREAQGLSESECQREHPSQSEIRDMYTQ